MKSIQPYGSAHLAIHASSMGRGKPQFDDLVEKLSRDWTAGRGIHFTARTTPRELLVDLDLDFVIHRKDLGDIDRKALLHSLEAAFRKKYGDEFHDLVERKNPTSDSIHAAYTLKLSVLRERLSASALKKIREPEPVDSPVSMTGRFLKENEESGMDAAARVVDALRKAYDPSTTLFDGELLEKSVAVHGVETYAAPGGKVLAIVDLTPHADKLAIEGPLFGFIDKLDEGLKSVFGPHFLSVSTTMLRAQPEPGLSNATARVRLLIDGHSWWPRQVPSRQAPEEELRRIPS